jgi:hypothetical protein
MTSLFRAGTDTGLACASSEGDQARARRGDSTAAKPLAQTCAHTHHAWNKGVEENMRATPTMQNLRRVSTRRHQNSSGRNRLRHSNSVKQRVQPGQTQTTARKAAKPLPLPLFAGPPPHPPHL